MLGSEACRYFNADTTIARYCHDSPESFLYTVQRLAPQVVVNCVVDKRGSLEVNALLPLRLRITFPGMVLVQPSTDAVFSGERGQYRVNELPDARTLYGQTKALGEVVANYPRTIVVRSSVVDGLKPVIGYANWHWNGVTTLEWCKAVGELLHEGFSGLCHVAAKSSITKLELARLLDGQEVVPQILPTGRDLTLVPTHPRPPIGLQLRELLDTRVAQVREDLGPRQ